ncbi:MAG: hypothetical protein JNL70_09550 [Saprospiraceae bacterium]|nr:hypothetical protein [Saprospiraceae bacterium]
MKASTIHTFILCQCICCTVLAQMQIQGGVRVGGIKYEGDLAPNSFVISTSALRFDFGAFTTYKLTNWSALMVTYHHGNLGGSDVLSNSSGRRERNLAFWSPVDELSMSGMFFYAIKHRRRERTFKPYLTLGVGLFRFNPQTQYNGVWYHLQPLSTEGQGLSQYPNQKPYKLVQPCFPLGAGFQTSISRKWFLAFDLTLGKTLTDYLDDVSSTYVPLSDLSQERGEIAAILSNRSLNTNREVQSLQLSLRGDSTQRDWYITGSISLVANIFGQSKRENLWQKKVNYKKCPKI